MKVLWSLLIVLTQFISSSKQVEIHSNHGPQKDKLSSILWRSHYSLKEYQSFQDVKLYALNVPVYTSEMRLHFAFFGYYSESHKLCSRTINVLLQQGSPAVPYRDDINTNSWLYNNSGVYKTAVSLDNSNQTNITSPLPGYWYVTAFLPHENKVKKIKEKGLSKPDENCLCALRIIQEIESPFQPPVVIGKGQTLPITSIRSGAVKYYQYFVPDNSENFRIDLRNHLSKNKTCSLKLSVSAKSLPSNSTSSTTSHDCTLVIKSPQPGTNYYIEVTCSRKLCSYEITANHTDCTQNLSACHKYHIREMSFIWRRGLGNSWPCYLNLNNTTSSFFSLDVGPNYVGTTLTFSLFKVIPGATFKMCIRKDSPPFDITESKLLSQQYCSTRNSSDIFMKVLFPQSGKWYIGVSVQAPNKSKFPSFCVSASMDVCLDSQCSGHGLCLTSNHIGISYGVCSCDYGYSGWTCADYHGLDILAICLLTISNIAFLPGILVALKRRFYPEAIVYLFNMYCSTVYHACDSHGRCIYDYNTLQLSDFFASVLSVWFTLMTMVKLPPLWHRTINIFGLLCLFIGMQISRFGVTMIAVPAGVGIGIVFISFGLKCYCRQKCFPSRMRWLLFLLPAALLAIIAILVYALLETTANYKYLHSLWHICIALVIPLLLPTVRKPKLFVEYNMIQQLDGGENFRDSEDSLMLNPWNNEQNQNEDDNGSEGTPFPQLVA